MVRTPQDHLGPQPITPTCDLLAAGCCPAAPGAVLGSLCSLRPRHTQGTQHRPPTSPATHLCQEQPLSLAHQGRPGRDPSAQNRKRGLCPEASEGHGCELWPGVRVDSSPGPGSPHQALCPLEGCRWGDTPAEAIQALPFPCTWQGEGPHMLRAQVGLRLRKQLRGP